MRQPTPEELAAAEGGTCRDVIGNDLDVLYCGINPSLMSAAVGHHFARAGNRFWKTLHGAGLTPRRLEPTEDATLPDFGQGITNLVARATRGASDLADSEFRRGLRRLEEKVELFAPRRVAFLGIGAYRAATGDANTQTGRQAARLRSAEVWVLPNPSGLNAHYQLADLIDLYAHLRNDS